MARKQRQHFPNGEESELGQKVFKKKVSEELYFPRRADFGKMNNSLYYLLSPKQIQKNISEKKKACPPAPHQGTPQKFPYPTSKFWDPPSLREGLPTGYRQRACHCVSSFSLFFILLPVLYTANALSIPNLLVSNYSTSSRGLCEELFQSLGR